MSVLAARDLFGFRAAVWASSYPTGVGDLTGEADNHPKITAVVVAVVGVAVVVFVAAVVTVIEATGRLEDELV